MNRHSIIVAIAIAIFSVGCAKHVDETVLKIINDIDCIGTIELEDEQLIINIEEAYKSLTDIQKDNVTNYETLIKARKDLNVLLEEKSLKEKEEAKAAEEFKRQSYLKFLKKMKGEVYISYDKIEKTYIINSISTNYYQDYQEHNIMPTILVTDNEIKYGLKLGFNSDDWIFTEKIIIAVNDDRFYFDVDYSDLKTKAVAGEGIYEIWAVIHSPSDNMTASEDLSPLLDILDGSYSYDFTLRFEGRNGIKDFTPKGIDIIKVVDFWRLYKILESDPSFMSMLQ